MYKAIIIDDEDLVREAIVALGKWKDFGVTKICEAHNAKAALEIMEKEMPHIVVTDMKMPVMDGVELLKELDFSHFNAKVIVVSGFSDYEYTRQAIRSNVVDYILKPIDSQDLNNAIAAAISEIQDEEERAGVTEEGNNELTGGNGISGIEKYIRDNFSSEITLEELANKFFISKEHISRSFKKQFNTNLFDYLTTLRIEKAKELILKTQYSVEEIALRVGFSNGNYFSKAFRKKTNLSPSEYRNRQPGK